MSKVILHNTSLDGNWKKLQYFVCIILKHLKRTVNILLIKFLISAGWSPKAKWVAYRTFGLSTFYECKCFYFLYKKHNFNVNVYCMKSVIAQHTREATKQMLFYVYSGNLEYLLGTRSRRFFTRMMYYWAPRRAVSYTFFISRIFKI